jgi:hypothetical protein
MLNIVDKYWFTRLLEMLPGLLAWSMLLLPFVLAPIYPALVAYFILAFSFYWFAKALNMMRNLLRGFPRLRRNMKIDWLDRCKLVSKNPELLLERLRDDYKKSRDRKDLFDLNELNNMKENFNLIKNWEEIYQVVFVTNFREDINITGPSYEAIKNSNYPNEKIIIVSCGERNDEKNYIKVREALREKYQDVFLDIQYYMHDLQEGEVRGKGANLYSAGHKFMEFLTRNHPEIKPENVFVTTLDGDHIIHKEYFSRLTYKYIIDPNRDRKTYQPVPILFNNIWDAPAPNRVLAMSNSFFQIIEAVRPFRLKTFAAHSQSLQTLLITDFWSNKTIVEDGHQFWRTYFAYNGDHEMVALFIPVYMDCVLAENLFKTFKNQYMQMRRWAWGISDFPFVVKNFMKHPEIPFGEKCLQTFRLFGGHFSWSTASFLLAFAWVPLLFNKSFQDTVLAHNVTYFSSTIMNLAWIGLFVNIWIFFTLLPKRPSHLRKTRYFGMIIQWLLVPVVALFLSAIPALESQTRLMIGKYLDYFWSTPKVRKTALTKETHL